MALVTVTYNAWDHNRQVVPANLQPEVWFRPLYSSLIRGLMTDREVKGTLNATTGAGQVQLESSDGLLFVPEMRWLVDSSQASESEQNRARGYCEWEAFFPDAGGNISDLRTYKPAPGQILHGYGPPPVSIENALYIDRSGAKPVLWGPSRGGI